MRGFFNVLKIKTSLWCCALGSLEHLLPLLPSLASFSLAPGLYFTTTVDKSYKILTSPALYTFLCFHIADMILFKFLKFESHLLLSDLRDNWMFFRETTLTTMTTFFHPAA